MSTATEIHLMQSRFRVIALILPVVITVVGLAIQLGTLSQVPDPMAINWELNGAPIGEGSPWVNVVMTAALGLVLPLLMTLTVFKSVRSGRTSDITKMLGALTPAFSLLMVVMGTASHVVQIGNDTVAEAHLPVAIPPFAVVVSIAVGILAWLWLPTMTTPLQPGVNVATQPSISPHASWVGTTTCTQLLGTTILIIVVAAVLAPLIVWAVAGPTMVMLILVIAALGAILAAASATSYSVLVNDAGLRARSRYGFPTFHVPLDDVVGVDIVNVDPISDFGGWGIRWMPGRFGIIMRGGNALRLIRRSGSSFVISLPEPEKPAGVIQAMLDLRDE